MKPIKRTRIGSGSVSEPLLCASGGGIVSCASECEIKLARRFCLVFSFFASFVLSQARSADDLKNLTFIEASASSSVLVRSV